MGDFKTPTAVVDNVRRNGRQFGDLMAARVPDIVACAQRLLAMPTRVRDEVDDRVHVVSGDQRPRVPGMRPG